jgi:nicotinate-nucleotide pyrophosphorylase (carboxylating)
MFSKAEERIAARGLIDLALREDMGDGDQTSLAVIPVDQQGAANIVARASGVQAGLPAVQMVFETLDSRLRFEPLVRDSSRVQPGYRLAAVSGPLRALLAGERTALNFLQHLSGIATLTRRYVDAIAGLPCKVLDTRKTTPGWRLLEKYAVRCGHGHNHRLGLFDGVLIKDNHLAARKASLPDVLRDARANAKPGIPLEVEVDTLEQLDQALPCGPDIVLLDNMTPAVLREAVRRRNAVAPQVLLEASGGVNLDTVRSIAETGVDRISVGALTHSAPALDIALDYHLP